MNTEVRTEIEKVKEKIIPVLHKHKIIHAGLFGSIIRGEITKDSDVDILVEFSKDIHIGLLGFAHIINELEDELNREVDLIEYSNIKPILKDDILKEEVQIL